MSELPGTEYGLSTADRNTTAWFEEHYQAAAAQVVDFLDGVSLEGRRIADIGCGDGIIDLGVAHRASPSLLVGFDVAPTDTGWLLQRARAEGVAEELPGVLEFRTSDPHRLPADDDDFDLVFTWSAFEHIADPATVCREIRRVLKPEGILMLQLWPFYHSEHGAHLWQSLPEPDGFIQLQRSPEEIEKQVRGAAAHDPETVDEFLEVFATLNRITLDDLQRALLSAGLVVTKLELMSETVRSAGPGPALTGPPGGVRSEAARRPGVTSLRSLPERHTPQVVREHPWAVAAHVASLVAGLGILAYANRDQWFFNDEWSFLARRGVFGGDVGILHPHNEHWVTIPIAIFRGLYSVFGVRSYLPYALVLVVVHLVLAHLLWQVLRTVGVDVPLATALVGPFVVLGAGYENLLWAFQIGFVGSVALGLVMVLLVNHDGPPGRRDLAAMGVALVGLMCSGLTITMVVVAGLTILFRRGRRAAVTFVAVPAAVYLLWFLLIGNEGLDAHRRSIDDVFGYPTFIWTGVQTAFERSIGFPGAGAVVVLAMGVWLLRRSELAGTRAAPAFAGALGILFLFGLLAVGRTSLGVGEAQAPRYVYTAVVLAIPAIGLALTELCAGVDVRRAAIFVVVALVALHNLGVLRQLTRDEGGREALIRGQILAAGQILSGNGQIPSGDGQILSGDGQIPSRDGQILGNLPEPAHSRHLTNEALLRMQRDGKLPGFGGVTEADRLSAQAALQLEVQLSGLAGAQPVAPALTTVSGAVAAPDGQGCVDLTPGSPGPAVELTGAAPLSVTVETSSGGPLTAALRTNGVTGASRALAVLPAATPVFLNMTASADTLALAIPPQGVTRICGLKT